VSGRVGLHAAYSVHIGTAPAIQDKRQAVLLMEMINSLLAGRGRCGLPARDS
jgi:hypothetical protein